jgi:hypothetical protein
MAHGIGRVGDDIPIAYKRFRSATVEYPFDSSPAGASSLSRGKWIDFRLREPTASDIDESKALDLQTDGEEFISEVFNRLDP